MEISPILQARLLLYAAILGVTAGILRDVFTTLKAYLKNKKIIYVITEFVTDFLCVCFTGISLVLLCYYFNKGEFRFFAVIGTAVGFFAYILTLSRVLKRLFDMIFKSFLSIIRLITRPLVKIFKYLVNILRKTIQLILKGLANLHVLMYNVYSKNSVLKRSRKGFLRMRTK